MYNGLPQASLSWFWPQKTTWNYSLAGAPYVTYYKLQVYEHVKALLCRTWPLKTDVGWSYNLCTNKHHNIRIHSCNQINVWCKLLNVLLIFDYLTTHLCLQIQAHMLAKSWHEKWCFPYFWLAEDAIKSFAYLGVDVSCWWCRVKKRKGGFHIQERYYLDAKNVRCWWWQGFIETSLTIL